MAERKHKKWLLSMGIDGKKTAPPPKTGSGPKTGTTEFYEPTITNSLSYDFYLCITAFCNYTYMDVEIRVII